MNRLNRLWVIQTIPFEVVTPHNPDEHDHNGGDRDCECDGDRPDGWDEAPLRRARFTWRSTQPERVVMVFRNPSGVVRWPIARSVLHAGLYGPAGLGDVAVLPDLDRPAMRELVLSGVDHTHTADLRVALAIWVDDLAEFLYRTGLDITDYTTTARVGGER